MGDPVVGEAVGLFAVGALEGLLVGALIGAFEGLLVGALEGLLIVGDAVGFDVGDTMGDYSPVEDEALLNMVVIVVDDDGGEGMGLLQVSGMTISPARIGYWRHCCCYTCPSSYTGGCSCTGQEQLWHKAQESPSHLRYRPGEAGESSERCKWWGEYS